MNINDPKLRFIPAGAGNTVRYADHSLHAPVYPRWRGEHGAAVNTLFLPDGLSPLARGTLNTRKISSILSRFIPAGAGNTSFLCSISSVHSVYPRWRGEHINQLFTDVGAAGLSPLARGTQNNRQQIMLIIRFIPAGAGNTQMQSTSSGIYAVYPRWRGEHSSNIKYLGSLPGLSPLARGTHDVTNNDETIFRFIPAGAGNTPLQ